MTRAPTVKRCMVNPSAQSFIVPQGSSNLQAEEAGIGVYEPWGDAPIAPMPVDQNQFALAHLPGLLDEFREDARSTRFASGDSREDRLHVDR